MATTRQKRALEKLVENNGKSVSRAMVEAGYPETTARNPQQLTRSKGWMELTNQYIPEGHLLKKNREFLDSKRQVRTFKKGELEIETEETDPSAVKALDIAYRVRNRYPKQNDGNTTNVIVVNVTKEGAEKYGIREVQPSAE